MKLWLFLTVFVKIWDDMYLNIRLLLHESVMGNGGKFHVVLFPLRYTCHRQGWQLLWHSLKCTYHFLNLELATWIKSILWFNSLWQVVIYLNLCCISNTPCRRGMKNIAQFQDFRNTPHSRNTKMTSNWGVLWNTSIWIIFKNLYTEEHIGSQS